MSLAFGLRPELLRRAASRHRGLLAGGLAAAAVATGLGSVVPADEPVELVLFAARDVPAGTTLSTDDLVTRPLARAAVPAGILRDAGQAAGRPVAGPLRRGEPLTDVRLLGAGLLRAGGEVAVPVRLAEPAIAAVLRAGDRVDVLVASPEGGELARAVASDVLVLAVPALERDAGEGTLVVLAAPASTGARLAAAAVTGRLSAIVRGR